MLFSHCAAGGTFIEALAPSPSVRGHEAGVLRRESAAVSAAGVLGLDGSASAKGLPMEE